MSLASACLVFVISLIFWKIIAATIGIRVSAEEEIEGLDIGEHGNSRLPGFRDGRGKRRNSLSILSGKKLTQPRDIALLSFPREQFDRPAPNNFEEV